MFVNRIKELESLNNSFVSESATFTVLYGRRRVGKTTLISEFIKQKRALYFYATQTTILMQLKEFSKEILRLTGFENILFDSFEDAFIFLAKHTKTPTVLVIDEYQNLVKVSKSFSSVLQKVWDMHLKDSKVHLIICGSTISMMHSEVLNYTAPLYGRSTAVIHLKPLLARYIYDFVPNIDSEIFMKIYSSFGTIPKYLEMYKKDISFEENIKTLMLNKNSFLYSEGYFLLKQEINEVSTYFSILEAISKGATKMNEIASTLGINSSGITKYLQTLIDLGFIEKEIPITEKNPLKSKLGRYRFKDNFLKFWFFYIYKNYRYLELDMFEYVLKEIEKNFADNFVSFAYEDFVKEQILLNPLEYLGFVPLKIGRWWNNKEEIDLVAFDDENIAFIECKHQNSPIRRGILTALKEKSKYIKHNLKDEYILFSKSGCYKDVDCKCFTSFI